MKKYNAVISIRSVFHDNDRYYRKAFSDEYLYESKKKIFVYE